MRLRLLLPNEIVIDEEVVKVTMESPDGYFCMLERHIDFVSAVVPGILFYERSNGDEEFVAVDEGTMVKKGSVVTVSVRDADREGALGELRESVEERFRQRDEMQRRTRSSLTRLQSDFIRSILDLEGRSKPAR